MKKLKEIEVKKIINSELANDSEKGKILNKEICRLFESNDTFIVLDFKDINLINTAFLNDAIGIMLRDYPLSEFTSKLRIKNIDKEDIDMFKEVLKNAAEKYIKTKRRSVE